MTLRYRFPSLKFKPKRCFNTSSNPKVLLSLKAKEKLTNDKFFSPCLAFDDQVDVLHFQSDGYHSTDSFLLHSGDAQIESGFSLCVWYSVDYWRGETSTMVSIVEGNGLDLFGLSE